MGAGGDDALPIPAGAGVALIVLQLAGLPFGEGLLASASAWAAEGTCEFRRNGSPTDRLVCAAGGAWTVHCPAPPAHGKVRATLSMPARAMTGEARVSLSKSGPMELAVSGPGGRPSAFLVDRKVAGLLPGQAIGPLQLCPVVQPGAVAGAPPAELPIDVVISIHEIVGYDEVPLDGGVIGSVPRYDAGSVWATGRATVVQPEVPLIPILTGVNAIPMDDTLRGTVSLRSGEAWATIGYSGFVRPVALAGANLRVLVVDFVASDVQSALGEDPATALREDLETWLRGETTLFSPTVWDRSEIRIPLAVSPWSEPHGGMAWRTTESERVQIRVGRSDLRLRVVIARSSAKLDGDARVAIETAATP